MTLAELGRLLHLWGLVAGGTPSLASSVVAGEWRCHLRAGPVTIATTGATLEEAASSLAASMRRGIAGMGAS